MAQLALACPYCRAEKIGFLPRAYVPYRPNESATTLLFMQCDGCGGGIVVTVTGHLTNVQTWIQNASASPGQITDIQPAHKALKSPADVPPNVQSAYLSGLENLGRPNGANAAAMMFRRSVEVAVKKLNPEGKGNLKERIAQLSADLATPAMKEWATHVRLDANEAAHETEEYSEADAKTLHTFAEMFLTYAFTLPEMLKKAKGPEPEPHDKI